MALTPESDELIRLSEAEEQELLEAMEEIRRGDYVDGDDFLLELRGLPAPLK